MSEIAYAKIFPPVGIARVGDSEDDDGWFIGPEDPGRPPHKESGFSFRDSRGRIKRQAARFRIFGFDSSGHVIRELTSDEAEITWSVTLANKKAAWFEFRGTDKALAVYRGQEDVPRARNFGLGALKLKDSDGVPRYVPDEERVAQLEIHGGTRSITGVSQSAQESNPLDPHRFVGRFKKVVPVELGEIRTDQRGRLIVLGGRGRSDAVDAQGNSIRASRWIRNYANNDDWFDDTSDGPVTATVKLRDGKRTVDVLGGAWVIVGPPDFAPDVKNLVTLYDVMEEVALRNPALVKPDTVQPRDPRDVYFLSDIAPILERVQNYRWVNSIGLRGHGFQKPGDFGVPGKPGDLAPELTSEAGQPLREKIFKLLRRPAYESGPKHPKRYDTPEATSQATDLYMPPLAGDEGDPAPGNAAKWFSLSYLQYDQMQAWCRGDFKPGNNPNIDNVPTTQLTQAAMEACAGGAFYPGIEITSIAREASLYTEAFRFDQGCLDAGDITKYMAVPWQADFWECQIHWWPAQRPDDVIPEHEFAKLLEEFTEETTGDFKQRFDQVLFNRQRWDRGIGRGPRPTLDYLKARLLPDADNDSLTEYIGLITARKVDEDDPQFLRFRRTDTLANVFIRLTPAGDFADFATDPWPPGKSGDRLPSPWRLQYVCQEALDAYSGLYFHLVIPSPESVYAAILSKHEETTDAAGGEVRSKTSRRGSHLAARYSGEVALSESEAEYLRAGYGIRGDWNLLCLKKPQSAAKILGLYAAAINQDIVDQLRTILVEHPSAAAPASGTQLRHVLAEGPSVADLERGNPQDFDTSDAVFKQLRATEMIEQAIDFLYLLCTGYAGDMDMVDAWRRHGFVVEQTRKFRTGTGEEVAITAQVETTRPNYDGQSFRDYFYYLMNIQDYPDFIPFAEQLANAILQSAQRLIDETGIFDSDHPESFVDYSRDTFAAKLEEIYEILRSQAATALGWRTTRNREDWIRRMLDTAPFNQTDGAWLRYIANAGPSDAIGGLLFQVWSDEVGNGDPSLHHGNLFTTLLSSLGTNVPPVSSRAYADSPLFDESAFIGSVFQLAISLHSEEFFPELLGMTLFLEWEVLSLVPGIKGREYIGLDAQFWRMHVGIDNASEGHGAKARQAVERYLDRVLKESGDAAMQAEWKRIWRGFVAFATAGYEYFGNKDKQDDLTIRRRHPATAQDDILDLIQRKAHYGRLNHLGNRLGAHRMNDLFDDPGVFVEELAHSAWIAPGNPKESKLLNYLTTFSGPMYKVFDVNDLALWREWIEWLGREGDTDSPKTYLSKANSMLMLLTELRELAQGSEGHRRYRLQVPGGGARSVSIAELFEAGDLMQLMKTIANPDNGWVVPGDPGASNLVLDLAKGGRPMGRALDRRFASLGNQVGRQVVIKWIEAGCPLPGEKAVICAHMKRPAKWSADQLFVQQLGQGAVH
jgi:hypothetical protein